MFVKFFIDRPIFASVIAIIIVLAGVFSIPFLPVAQFPSITPPTVVVDATFTGANSEVVESTVTAPLEEQINGVKGMMYMSSTSADDGSSTITVTFEVGYDPDIAAVDVQNRVALAQPQLPQEVAREGIDIEKQAPFVTLCMGLVSPDGRYDDAYLSNYADIHVADILRRIKGVGAVTLFGMRRYAMRIWLDPDKLTSLGMTPTDVADAITAQNLEVAAGALGQPPAPAHQKFHYPLGAKGRLKAAGEFGDIILRADPGGSIVRIRDVGRAEMGAETYDDYGTLNGEKTINICLFESPGGNSLDIASRTYAEMARLAGHFPDGMEYRIIYDTTRFVRASIREVVITLLEAVALVFLVIFVFLRDWRATLIPAITIPVSLIGTFALLKLMGFSVNTFTLFGLVLAVGLVVDDAIVVVENVARQLVEKDLSPREAAAVAMGEVTGPVIATTLILFAVFVPVAFLPNVSGQLYRQFALTIVCAVGISAINALTLSPALSAVFLRRKEAKTGGALGGFARGFAALQDGYERAVHVLARHWIWVVATFVLLVAATLYMFRLVPVGFVPNEDQGYFMVTIELPEGASLQRTLDVMTRVDDILKDTKGVDDVVAFGGYSFIDNATASNVANVFGVLAPWSQRKSPDLHVEAIIKEVSVEFARIEEAVIAVFNPPAIHGMSQTGGFQFVLEDRESAPIHQLADLAHQMVEEGNRRPELQGLYTSINAETPGYFIELDRTKAMTEGVEISDIFDALQIYMGSFYVNDFNRFGRVYHVYVQAEADARAEEEDINRIHVRNRDGSMTPLGALVAVRPVTGARDITHYNMYRAATINGEAGDGYSSGQAIAAMEELAADLLPPGYGYEWTGLAFEQLKSGHLTAVVFALSLVFAFLFLAALYESWTMPFMVILAVPLAILGALSAQYIRGLDNDIYCQIGLVMLIGLASKNAILIVEFARRRRREGLPIVEAAAEAARVRLRPVLMTAFAFILGVLPLVFAEGAGAAGRHSIGTAVFGGMLLATVLSLILVPVLYVVIESMRERGKGKSPAEAA
ncbi:MAG: multidrug efflux RND transporter permease subunit [Pseudomonadota bacterium]|nr:multidrug efflux RND transporter permease subunit [Pseudomonadota bacterium]